MTLMEEIEQGLKRKHRPGETEFADAVYSLFDEFKNVYQNEEWPRITNNEKMYRGDHWHDVPTKEPNEPRPTTPIVQSTIENIRADMTDEYPEAIIKPEELGDEIAAKVLSEIVAQDLEAADYDAEYDKLTHDLLVGGWMVQETGWDETMHQGKGGAFVRHVSNANIMFDPHTADLQNGRAVFKFERLHKDYFRHHYPDYYKYMGDDSTILPKHHGQFDNFTEPIDEEYLLLIEAWFRFYEKGKYRVHMVKLAGYQVLENSYLAKPQGYFAHGKYPFVVTPLYTQKGTPLGIGVVDMYGKAQKYSDKLDQILLINAMIASKPKLLVSQGLCDVDDLRDYSKSVHEIQGNPQSAASWHNPPPLPSHILAYMQTVQQSIKEESGSNDFSRGNATAGVTAASAITALQEMSSKRSRMEARRIHYGFKQAVRMLLDVEREFGNVDRLVTITHEGQPVQVLASKAFYRDVLKKDPVEFHVSIKTMRETKFTRLANNELMLQAVNIFGQSADPVIIFEGMEFEGKEVLLEKLRAAQGKGIMALQQQLMQAQGSIDQLAKENQSFKQAIIAMQGNLIEEQASMP